MYPSEPFPHFVDDYLAYLHEVFPSQASLDGVHLHDDLLEDLAEPPAEAGHRADMRLDGGPAQILEEIVMQVHAVQAGLAGEHLVKIGEVVVDEVWKWLRWIHA